MKKNLFIVLAFSFLQVFAQSPISKITSQLEMKLNEGQQSDNQLIWIFFNDKGNDLQKYYSNPHLVVSKKSIERRTKVLSKKLAIDFSDIPVNEYYIKQLIAQGFILKQKSKWLNAVSGYANKAVIEKLSSLNFIKKIDAVVKFSKKKEEIKKQESNINLNKSVTQPTEIKAFNFGPSLTQLALSNIQQVLDLGYSGAGVTICMMDAGFDNLQHEVFSRMNIIAKWDFVNGDSVVSNQNDMGEGSHGTATLSIIGGFKEGQLIGPAYGANFILAKTENTDSETPVEEDNWIAAVEWADSIGVDVTSTSLGYLGFDDPNFGYTWEDMNGNTARITIAADAAASKGIVVVNSAGNEGYNATHNTLDAPADGDSVIAVGAVNANGVRTSFSSVGPTVDGRIKPDVMAMGSNVYFAGSYGNSYEYGDGTSFSCPLVAGVCALLLEAKPTLQPMEVLQILKSNASQSNDPNNLYGWGIVNAYASINSVITNIDNKKELDNLYLLTNYPNPFNPATTIRFAIPEKSNVKILIYDILGNEISTLFNDEADPGIREIKFDGSSVPGGLSSGIYFVRMISKNVQKTLKISLTK